MFPKDNVLIGTVNSHLCIKNALCEEVPHLFAIILQLEKMVGLQEATTHLQFEQFLQQETEVFIFR